MSVTKRIAAIAFLVCCWFLAPPTASGQIQYVSPQTTYQAKIISGATASTTVQIKDVGQNVHFLTYSSNVQPCAMNIRLEGSYDGITYFPISEDGADPVAFLQDQTAIAGALPGLVAYGWFPVERVNLLISTALGNACNVTANYSGTSTADSTIQQGFIQSLGYRKLISLQVAPASFGAQVPAPYGTTAGRLYILCQGSCSGGTVTVTPVSIPIGSGGGSGTVVTSCALTSAATIQTCDITPVPAESVNVNLTGSVAATWITAYYQFISETTIGNTINVICTSGCTGGSGSGVVWGPNAIGAAPTEPPVQVGGLNPSGNVAELQTDAAGRTIAVGPTAVGSAITTNPQLVAGEVSGTTNVSKPFLTDGNGNTQVVGTQPNFTNTGVNPVIIGAQDYTIGGGNFLAAVGFAPNTRALMTAPAALGSTQGFPLSGSACTTQPVQGLAQMMSVPLNITGTWSGAILFNVSYVPSPFTYVAAMVYPLGTNGYPSGSSQASITADGQYMFYGTGIYSYQLCAQAITGTAVINMLTDTTTNAMFVNQPVAANLHARTEPNAAPNSACTETPITFSASGNNTIVAAVAAQSVRIYEISIAANAATNITFQDGASTALTGPIGLLAGGAINVANEGAPHFMTSSGNAFVINSSAAVQVSGWACYGQF